MSRLGSPCLLVDSFRLAERVPPGQCSSRAALDTQTTSRVQSLPLGDVACTVFLWAFDLSCARHYGSSLEACAGLCQHFLSQGDPSSPFLFLGVPSTLPSLSVGHWSCVSSGNSRLSPSRKQLPHWAIEDCCFPPPRTKYPQAPNTCIGGSGAGAVVVPCTYVAAPSTAPLGSVLRHYPASGRIVSRLSSSRHPGSPRRTRGIGSPSCLWGSWGLAPLVPFGFVIFFDHTAPLDHATLHTSVFRDWQQAPKRRIGGSGTSACSQISVMHTVLELVGSLVVPFFNSLAVLASLALFKLLVRQLSGRKTVAGRPIHSVFATVPAHILRGWQIGSAKSGPLTYLAPNKPRHKRGAPRPCLGHSLLRRGLTAILGFMTLPVCVWATPAGLKEALTLTTSVLQSAPEHLAEGIGSPRESRHFQEWVAEALNSWEDVQTGEFHTPRHCVILQAGFPTQYLLTYTHIPCAEPTFLHAAAELGLPRYQDHTLVPTLPQLSDGLASLVAVPSWTAATDKVVVILDFTQWHGPVYAVLDWSFITLASFGTAARKYTDAPWQVYHANNPLPVLDEAHVIAANGDVFYFVPHGARPPQRFPFADMLNDPHLWSSCPQSIPKEITAPIWYALMSHVTRTPAYTGICRQELQEITADTFNADAGDLDFEYPLEDSPLNEMVYRGQLVRGVLAARLWTPQARRPGIFVFLDTRLVGLCPTFWFCSAGWVALEHFTDGLAIRVPPGFHLVPTGIPIENGQVLVSDRCTITLSFAMTEAPSASIAPSDPNAGVADSGAFRAISNPAADLLQNSRTARQRDARHSPDPETLLEARTRSEETDGPTSVCFQVLVPDFQTEIVEVDLRFPCSLDDALLTVEQARRSGTCPYFDQLIPANPQPDVSFGTVLAFPAWQDSQRIVLVDARLLDGRFFAVVIEGRLNRSSVLLHLRTPDTPGLQVYLKSVLLDTTTWYSFGQGDTLFLIPPGAVLRPHVRLADMLEGTWDWTSPCPSYPGPHFPAFCVLSDGGIRVILVDVEVVRSFSDFRRQAVAELQYTSDRALVSSSLPRMSDLSILGQACKALLVATEAIVRVPIPPGRIQLHRTIAFLDKRLIFKGVDWRIAERGLLDFEELVDSLQEGVPHGYAVSVTGAPTTLRLGRTYLSIANGTLLTIRYVEDALGSDNTSDHASSSSSGSEFEAGSGDPTGNDAPANGHEVPPAGVDAHRNRSRTPPRNARGHNRQEALVVSGNSPATADLKIHWASNNWPSYTVWGQYLPAVHRAASGLPLAFSCFGESSRIAAGTLTAKQQRSPVSSKLLNEPSPTSGALQAAIASLRYLAPRLGPAWRYIPGPNAPQLTDSDSAATSDASGEPVALHFAVLALGFVPEHVVVTVSLPETLDAVIARLQVARNRAHAEAFPVLLPANPQPCPGSGVVIALPDWTADASCQVAFLCLDTTLVDGRVFTVASPTYVSRRHLIHLARFTGEIEVDVHTGDDPTPLDAHGQFHVTSGDTFVFAPAGAIIPSLRVLALELQDVTAWSRASTFVPISSRGHLGLVHGFETVLFTAPPEGPGQYRSQIAACVGVRQQDLQLSPASPGIRDATLHGFFCGAIIAITEALPPPDVPSFGVLVDARFLHQGWRAYSAIAGVISCNTIRLTLQRDAPTGWYVGLKDTPEHVDLIDVSPGQVIVAFSRKPTRSNAENEPAVTAAGDGTSRVPDQGETQPTPPSAPDTPTFGSAPTDAHLGHHGALSTAQSGNPRRVTFAAESYRLCSFLVLGQNYLPEHVEVRLPAGISVAQAIGHVSDARAPDDVLRLPMLCEVFPQPQAWHALCIATPSWETAGPIVAFDSRSINGRLFALQLVGRVDRVGLLTAAQLDTTAGIEVYIGSQPWPLPDHHPVTLFYGELVFFTYPQAPRHIVASLQDMLNDEGGWISDFDLASQLAPGYNSTLWLLGDETNLPFELQPHRHGQLRADIARLLNFSERELVLQPAHLTVPDYAYRGVATRTLLAALHSTEFIEPDARSVVCFIDARPIMLTLTWRVCPHGVLDTQSLSEVYASRCPPGLTLCVLRSDHAHLALGSSTHVEAGEVLTVLFLASLPRLETLDAPSPPREEDDENSDASDDAAKEDRRAGHVNANTQAGALTGPASTGGTGSVQGGALGHLGPYHTGTWTDSSLSHAVHAGDWTSTSACLDSSGRAPCFAVCNQGPQQACLPGTPTEWKPPQAAGEEEARHSSASRRSRSSRKRAPPNGSWVAGFGLAYLTFSTQPATTAAVETDTLPRFSQVARPAYGCPWATQLVPNTSLANFVLTVLGLLILHYGPRLHKVLQEPRGRNASEQAHLDTLRSLVSALGGPWMPRLPFMVQHLAMLDPGTGDDEHIEAPDEVAQVCCVVLVLDFTPAVFTVDLQLPATTEELIAALQPLREERMQSHFPHLLPVRPQPRDDVATFVAAPHWCPLRHGVCFDSSSVDNRTYCTFVPEYVNLEEVLRLANLPENLAINVWVGPDLVRLEHPGRIPTYPGMLFSFRHEGDEPVIPVTLGQLLQFRSWDSPIEIPEPFFQDAYCLAYSGPGRLFFADPTAPMRYRHRIAEATGANPAYMRLYACEQRPRDTAISGVPCTTVIAVGDRRRDYVRPAWHMAFARLPSH